MAENNQVLSHVEVDHSRWDLVVCDEAGQSLRHLQVFCLVDCATGWLVSSWLEPLSAPTPEEPKPPTMSLSMPGCSYAFLCSRRLKQCPLGARLSSGITWIQRAEHCCIAYTQQKTQKEAVHSGGCGSL